MVSTHTHIHTHAHFFFFKYFSSLKSMHSNFACMGNKTHILEFLSSVYVEFSMEKLSQEHNVLCFWWIADSILKGKSFLSKKQ